MRLKYSVLLLAIALTGCDNKKDEIGCSSVTGSFKPSGLFPPALQK